MLNRQKNSNVRKFLTNMGFELDKNVMSSPSPSSGALLRDIVCPTLNDVADRLYNVAVKSLQTKDYRLFQMYLLLREVAEVSESLGKRDGPSVTHELADVKTVIDNMSELWNLPVEEAVPLIQESNLTRDLPSDGEIGGSKGEEYVEPNVRKLF